jgi:hypothetical protein
MPLALPAGPQGAAGLAGAPPGYGTDLFTGTPEERAWRVYLELQKRGKALADERAAIMRKSHSGSLSPEEQRRLAELSELMGQARAAFLDFCARLRELLSTQEADPLIERAACRPPAPAGLPEPLLKA